MERRRPTVTIEGTKFVDGQGRTLMLRGVNLAGSSKVPAHPLGATHRRQGLFDHRDLSFVGRPFPLSEATEHLDRLRRWGLTTLRFLVTWEAIEHRGPGEYDEAYLDFVRAVLEEAARRDMHVIIDPHQDVWSRFSGGDGAPGWTLEAVGFDLKSLEPTGAAVIHQLRGGDPDPLLWTTNGAKLAAATMFSLFFAGERLAPRTTIDGESAQQVLQRHYFGALARLARHLVGLPNVLGFETMNEPLVGYIGQADLTRPAPMVELGLTPSPLQSMALGEGIAQQVESWRWTPLGPRRERRRRKVVPAGARAWREGYQCPWRENGVWTIEGGEPRLLRPQHFTHSDDEPIDFARDCYRPFANGYARAIRGQWPGATIFLDDAWGQRPPRWSTGDAGGIAYAPHWYDGLPLLLEWYTPWLAAEADSQRLIVGRERARRSVVNQLGQLKGQAASRLGGGPTVLGEFGVAMDLRRGRAFRSGDFTEQARALDRTFTAVEANLLHATLWNYTPDNTNVHGDGWNGEDLSIFSRDQQRDPADPDSGGRALSAVVRPYPRATAGEPLRLWFDRRTGRFEYEFRHDPAITAPTEIFVPRLQYPGGFTVEATDGHHELDRDRQLLRYFPSPDRTHHRLILERSPRQKP